MIAKQDYPGSVASSTACLVSPQAGERFAFNTGSGVRFQTELVADQTGDTPPRNFDYLGSKSAEAFKITVDRLFANARQVFMWSLTFADIPSIDDAQERLRKFLQQLRRRGLYGVRVLELHPGGHGVHYHLLIPQFVRWQIMRRIASRCGFGRVHVCERFTDSRYYMAKHFVKQTRFKCLKHVRLWSAWGGHHWELQGGRKKLVRPFHCKIGNLIINSREHEIFRALRASYILDGGKGKQLRYDENCLLWAKACEIFAQEISAGRKLFKGDELPGREAARLVFN